MQAITGWLMSIGVQVNFDASSFDVGALFGMGGMGGGMNMNMIKQAQKMQQDMMRMQQELEEKTYEASAGGGVVTATVSGKRELKA